MKQLVFGILLTVITALLFLSCSDKKTLNSSTNDESSITIAFGDTVAIPGTDLSITFAARLYDQRRPIDYPYSPYDYNTALVEFTLLPTQQHLRMTISGNISNLRAPRFYGAPVTVDSFRLQITTLKPLPDNMGMPAESELVAHLNIEKIEPVPNTETDYLPLAVGNKWVFSDSTFQNGVFTNEERIDIEVTSDFYDALGHWWVLNRWFYGIPYVLLVSNDTVFSRQGHYPLRPGEVEGSKNIEFAPLNGPFPWISQIAYGVDSFLRDIYPYDSSITTTAGTFFVPYRYSGSAYYHPSTEYLFSPQTGIIEITAGNRNDIWFSRSRLVEVNLH